MSKPAKNTICLWYDGDAEDAARFYAKTFPNSSVGGAYGTGKLSVGKKGDVLTVEFKCNGNPLPRAQWRIRSSSTMKPSRFRSPQRTRPKPIAYWTAIVGNGGEESECGWCRDKWGVSWQITPVALMKAPDRSQSRRRQARLRCDDAHEKDRHRDNRGGTPRLTNIASSPFARRWPLCISHVKDKEFSLVSPLKKWKWAGSKGIWSIRCRRKKAP